MSEIVLFFDTETTGKADFKSPHTESCQPDLVQLAAILWDQTNEVIRGSINVMIHPYFGADPARNLLFRIPDEAAAIHKVSQADAVKFGQPRRTALSAFNHMCRAADLLVAYNIEFDRLVMHTAYHREGVPHRLTGLAQQCCMKAATPVCMIPKPAGWKVRPGDEYKWPTLTEAHFALFNCGFDGAHDAMVDVLAMKRVWIELRRLGAV